MDKSEKIEIINNAVLSVIGVNNKFINHKRATRKELFALIILAYHLNNKDEMGIKKKQIAKYLHHSNSCITYYLSSFDKFYKFNKEFRELATEISNKIENDFNAVRTLEK